MTNEEWQTNFRAVWDRAVTAWKEGKRSAGAMFEVEDVMFLFSNGCLPQEMFDFVDDAMSYDDVTYETVLEVTSVRRDYFLNVLGGMRSGVVVPT